MEEGRIAGPGEDDPQPADSNTIATQETSIEANEREDCPRNGQGSGLRVQINSSPIYIDDASSQHTKDRTPPPEVTRLGPRVATYNVIQALQEGDKAQQSIERALKTLAASPNVSNGSVQEAFRILDEGLFLNVVTKSSILRLVDRAPSSKNGVTYAPGNRYAERTAILLGRCFFLEHGVDARPWFIIKALVHQMIHAYLLGAWTRSSSEGRKDGRLDHGKYFCAIQFSIRGVMNKTTCDFDLHALHTGREERPYEQRLGSPRRRKQQRERYQNCTRCTTYKASACNPISDVARWLELMRPHLCWTADHRYSAFGIGSRQKAILLEKKDEKPVGRYVVTWKDYHFFFPEEEIEEKFPTFAQRWSNSYNRMLEFPDSADFTRIEPLLTFLKTENYETPKKLLKASTPIQALAEDSSTKVEMFEHLTVDAVTWSVGQDLGFPDIQAYAEHRIIRRAQGKTSTDFGAAVCMDSSSLY